jgi:hypothetical protein
MWIFLSTSPIAPCSLQAAVFCACRCLQDSCDWPNELCPYMSLCPHGVSDIKWPDLGYAQPRVCLPDTTEPAIAVHGFCLSAAFRLEAGGKCQTDVLVVSERVEGAATKLFPIK